MKKDEVYATIDEIRLVENCFSGNVVILRKISNYIEANVDEFIECYHEYKEDK